MTVAIITTVISVVGGLFAAAASYWFTKQREREAEWRKEKLGYYKSFVESMSGALHGDSTPDGQRAFAKATNNLLLFASQPVIEALNEFREEISISNPNRSQQKHDKLLAQLLLEIRRDTGVNPRDNPKNFKPRLWTSGANTNEP